VEVPQAHIRKYWFGVDDEDAVADTVLLMERDRLEQYKAALDLTECHFKGVFSGITGRYNGRRLSVVYSIGPAHVADCVNFLAYGFNIKQFIATGSIGGLNADMGDIVVSNSCSTQDGYSLAMLPAAVRSDETLGAYVDIAMPGSPVVPPIVVESVSATFDCGIRYGKLFTVPAVSLEARDRLRTIRDREYAALDLETGPFLTACTHNKVQGLCIHWVTDLPLSRSFYYQYDGDPAIIVQDRAKKHRQWLNMPRMILPILESLVKSA
jgi:uridine phosphorylase